MKTPITGIGNYVEPEDIAGQSTCDFIATAAYWDSPVFSKNKTNFKINNTSVLEEKDLGILGKIRNLDPNLENQKNKPFIVSEWNHSFPNEFSYESPTLLGSVAGINNWDGLFQFAYCLDTLQKPGKQSINNFFEIINNPQQLILCSIAGLAYKYEFETSKIKGRCGFTDNKLLINKLVINIFRFII